MEASSRSPPPVSLQALVFLFFPYVYGAYEFNYGGALWAPTGRPIVTFIQDALQQVGWDTSQSSKSGSIGFEVEPSVSRTQLRQLYSTCGRWPNVGTRTLSLLRESVCKLRPSMGLTVLQFVSSSSSNYDPQGFRSAIPCNPVERKNRLPSCAEPHH
ncbi:hypothetical protein B0H16DRAFT_1694500 [Mycena metata]|uniref:Uncharacterized protein n=1 Tax=Mycena metata TaxID=1033252 RepID=A0AAD7IBU9_9AGAR|nr:hypothetical protein B0H16DRAFT_1694500 [Mycena metata]